MDRSFLSQPAVIEASREFVCVRLTTYEDPDEAKYLKGLVRTKSGEVENSAFCVLAPDGQTRLVRAGRSMKATYDDAAEMAAGMKTLIANYRPKGLPASLPLVNDVRLATTVAASDYQPLVILVSQNGDERQRLEAEVAQLAWNREFVGRFVFVSTEDGKSLAKIEGAKPESRLLVVQPDKFGTKGKVLAQTSGDDLNGTLAAGGKAFVPEPKSFMNHIREGKREGVFWETKTPVTDPEEQAARKRGRE